MKRFIIPVLLLGSAGVSAAQNLQLHYDFGKALYRSEDRSLEYRPQLTTTVEMFRPDRWGSTFFFPQSQILGYPCLRTSGIQRRSGYPGAGKRHRRL